MVNYCGSCTYAQSGKCMWKDRELVKYMWRPLSQYYKLRMFFTIVSFFCHNAEATITGTSHQCLQQKNARSYRNIILTRLCDMISSNACAAQSCVAETHLPQWVLCDNCRLWYHFLCEKLTEKPGGPFYCSFCQRVIAENVLSEAN